MQIDLEKEEGDACRSAALQIGTTLQNQVDELKLFRNEHKSKTHSEVFVAK